MKMPSLISLALLGIAQRQIRTERAPDTGITRKRKAFPIEVKTFGELLRKARGEANLTQQQLAALARLKKRDIQYWERDKIVPTETQSRTLAEFLLLKTEINPTVE
jgi:ribosome-binding protein aMBF1 (putative translation factor)